MSIFTRIKYGYQRMKKGYCDNDLFNVNDWILETIPNMLKEFLIYNNEILVNDKEFDDKIVRICYCFKESDESTCSQENEYYEEYSKALWGDAKKIDDIFIPCEENDKLLKFNFKKVPKELLEKYKKRNIEISEYQKEMRKEAFDTLNEIFPALWI